MSMHAEPAQLAEDALSEWEEFQAWKRRKQAEGAPAPTAQVDEGADEEGGGAPAPEALPDELPAGPAAKTQRPITKVKLNLAHFAFLRSVVEGLDLRACWDHYLSMHGDVSDIRAVHRAVRQLRIDIAAVARRHDRHGLARLLGLDVARIGEVAPPASLPSLEAFALEHGLEDFTVAEQLRAYEEEYGAPTRRQQARARLLARQLAGLRWLENQAATTPVAEDPPGAWLIPEIAAPIEAAGLITLRQLAERINGMGAGWHASLQGIGAGKAARVVRWLRAVDHDTGLSIGAHVDKPRRQLTSAELAAVTAPATDIVPIEKLIVPLALSGAAGRYRAPVAHCVLGVDTDLDALYAYIRTRPPLSPADLADRQDKWLRQHPGEALPDGQHAWLLWLTTTASSYLQEIYRCMLWALLEREKPLSSLDQVDAAAYRDFLLDPQPEQRWCSAARGRERYGPAWRPFAGPLGANAAARALTIIGGFYRFLRDGGYVVANPFAGVAKPRVPETAPAGRSLTVVEWGAVLHALDELPDTPANRRLRFGVRFMYATGLRRSEAVAAKVGDLRWVSYPPDEDDAETVEGWELQVLGKGSKVRRVPVPPVVAGDLVAYLRTRGLTPNLADPANASAHLIGQAGPDADPLAGIGAQTWHDQLVAFFRRCAAQMEGTAPAAAAQLSRASAHWLRHTRVSHSLAAGTDADVERLVAGHSSIGTTSGYAHAEGKRRMRGSERFFESWGIRHP